MMITSKQNEKIKFIRSLADKKVRDETELFVAEGVKTVFEALRMDAFVKTVVVTDGGMKLLSEKKAVFSDEIEILHVSDQVFKSLSNEVTPQGAIAVICKKNSALKSPLGRCLLLDEVKDPSNVGAIIRTAAAAGYKEIYLVNGSADAYGAKAVRASMSGIFAVDVYCGEREEILKVIDCPIYVADMDGKNVFELMAEQKFCLAIGNEGHGVSKDVYGRAAKVISIPMDSGIESLNAGVSAGILMYALKNSIQGEK